MSVQIPDRTHTPNRSVHARALFRRGDRPAAYRALRSHIDELLDTDNMQGTCVAAIEFINMMAAAGRYQDSTQLLGFLDATGLLDNAAWATLIADTRDTPSTAEPVPTGHRSAITVRRWLTCAAHWIGC